LRSNAVRVKISTATEMIESKFARVDMILGDGVDGLVWRKAMGQVFGTL
jgi:hypothetical protein